MLTNWITSSPYLKTHTTPEVCAPQPEHATYRRGGIHTHTHFEPASAQTSHSASHSTPLHTLPNPSLFMTITTGLLSSNTCVCMQSLDFRARMHARTHAHTYQLVTSWLQQWQIESLTLHFVHLKWELNLPSVGSFNSFNTQFIHLHSSGAIRR